jgi:hypothetical protein
VIIIFQFFFFLVRFFPLLDCAVRNALGLERSTIPEFSFESFDQRPREIERDDGDFGLRTFNKLAADQPEEVQAGGIQAQQKKREKT